MVDSGPLTLSSLARQTELPASTTMRMLRVLEHWNYVTKTEDGRFVVGARFAQSRFSPEPASIETLNDLSAPILDALTSETGESSYIGVRGAANTCVYLREVQSPHPIRHVGFAGWQGRTVPMTGSAVAEVFEGRTPDTGYVVMNAIVTPEATVIAAPVHSATGEILAVLSIVGPSYRLGATEIATAGPRVVAAADSLSSRL
ncbi:helix-turn-helix domain-containing protein [Leucobacter allii]|uniref:IclR family transcriptional regulator n=1 Tax=Leucobacter allii TaxID=2932247 RepID=UPI001FD11950|nr:helix-turn-helix domain-containing protein [Leucobacter allii]UOR02166.1 helix-turn-helix domain-containing protein [Leucobacter allii]